MSRASGSGGAHYPVPGTASASVCRRVTARVPAVRCVMSSIWRRKRAAEPLAVNGAFAGDYPCLLATVCARYAAFQRNSLRRAGAANINIVAIAQDLLSVPFLWW